MQATGENIVSVGEDEGIVPVLISREKPLPRQLTQKPRRSRKNRSRLEPITDEKRVEEKNLVLQALEESLGDVDTETEQVREDIDYASYGSLDIRISNGGSLGTLGDVLRDTVPPIDYSNSVPEELRIMINTFGDNLDLVMPPEEIARDIYNMVSVLGVEVVDSLLENINRPNGGHNGYILVDDGERTYLLTEEIVERVPQVYDPKLYDLMEIFREDPAIITKGTYFGGRLVIPELLPEESIETMGNGVHETVHADRALIVDDDGEGLERRIPDINGSTIASKRLREYLNENPLNWRRPALYTASKEGE